MIIDTKLLADAQSACRSRPISAKTSDFSSDRICWIFFSNIFASQSTTSYRLIYFLQTILVGSIKVAINCWHLSQTVFSNLFSNLVKPNNLVETNSNENAPQWQYLPCEKSHSTSLFLESERNRAAPSDERNFGDSQHF